MDADRMREAEVGVIGAVLLVPDKTLGILARWGVAPEWFGNQVARDIMGVVMPLHAEGAPIDVLTVCDALRRSGKGDHCEVVEKCFETVPTAAHADYYVGMLRDGWLRRAARGAAEEMSRGFEDGKWAPKEVVAQCMGKLTALLEASLRGQVRTAHEIKSGILAEWQAAADGSKSAMGLNWPLASMDGMTCGIYPGVTVVAARPSVGKTMFEGMMVRKLLMKGKSVARASLDMGTEPLLARDLCALAGESLNRLRKGFMTPSDRTKMDLTLEAMRKWQETVLEERTSAGIVARARALKATKGLDLLTVDYAQLVDVGVSNRDNDNVRIAKAMAAFKEFSLTTKTPVVILSQLSREVEKEGRRPQLSDLRDSGSIEQDASAVVFLYAEPKVAKLWVDQAGVGDVKELAVRPVMWDLLKQQQGQTGRVGLRQHAKYFWMEQAYDSQVQTETSSGGWEFAEPGRPNEEDWELNTMVIGRHPKGAVEAFHLDWFNEINLAAERLGVDGYKEVARACGVQAAVAALTKERAGGRS